ncbi:uncharacterized protein LOC122093135 [Macadamia integrifolia]|uniref:uncharacterized protein LOC122093135 n=1 Tax=Macadamia integrifolia TaxID=60698 RepID=UPI001C4E3692|nr:uncharacterized protein LOC122093135 [Macadamia integrifolia]XP_042519339.1 uncharacterized protein LOC122093135 [Macadamia integrifolia]
MENMTSLHYILLSGRANLRYIPKLPSSLIELRLCEILESSTDLHNMKRLELLCLKQLCMMEEQFIRGVVRTSYGEFNVLEHMSGVDQFCVHYSGLSHDQVPSSPFFLKGACKAVNNKGRRQIWIRLQERDACLFRNYLIPDDEIYSRLIIHISLRVSGFDPILAGLVDDVVRVNTTLNFKACIHSSKDQKITYCETRLRIEDIELINPEKDEVHNLKGVDYRYIDHVHRFRRFDWFGFQLEGGDTIEILEINQEDLPHDDDDDADNEYSHERGICCAVTELNLFVIKEEPNLEMCYSQSITAAPEKEEERTNEKGDAEGEGRSNETIINILLRMMRLVLLLCSSTN